jgi:hypothetical protein
MYSCSGKILIESKTLIVYSRIATMGHSKTLQEEVRKILVEDRPKLSQTDRTTRRKDIAGKSLKRKTSHHIPLVISS